MSWQELVGVAVGSGGLGALVPVLANRRKTNSEGTKIDAEAAQVIADTAVTLVAPLQSQIAGLLVRVETVEKENVVTSSKLKIAIDHIRDLRSWISENIPHKEPPQTPHLLGL